MSILLFLIPVTLILGLVGLMCFLWSLQDRQYDDLDGAANRILFDEDVSKTKADLVAKSDKSDSKNSH